MNEYRFKDLEIGHEEVFEYVVTEEKMNLFQRLSGDNNPLHVDEDFAKKHGFENRVVYGMLSASLISTCGGVYLPGKYCLIQQVESKFLAPVFIGDVLSVKGIVSELNESVQQAVIKIEIRNQTSKKVVRAKLSVGFLE
jgi:3-hydroxybutyryl-CoA dehydratase